MRPTTQKQASRRAEIEARRYDALQLKIAGYSDREIARRLGVGVSTAHNDVKNVLEALAREHAEEAANLRALLNIRYEELFHAYYDQAIAGDTEATKIVVGIMERVAKINGVIPDRSLVTVDQRALHLDGGEVTFSIAAASGLNRKFAAAMPYKVVTTAIAIAPVIPPAVPSGVIVPSATSVPARPSTGASSAAWPSTCTAVCAASTRVRF